MQQSILNYLAANWHPERTQKLVFSPVPKGQAGDLALQFFSLTKELKKSPIALANQVAEVLEDCPFIEKTQGVGPYLNLFFSTEAFFADVFKTPLESRLFLNKNIVLEFSGPNTNKPLHLGHMRNHALGISVSNLLEATGANVHRVNIINDRGIHICKSMLAYQLFGNDKTPENTNQKSDAFVGRYYVKFDQEAKIDPSLETQAQKMLLNWEANDPKTKALWNTMSQWTLSGHQTTYARQGVTFEKIYKESDYYLEGKNIAQMGLENGAFHRHEDGKIVINLEAEKLGEKVVLRADGTSIYLTQDLAVAVARDQDFNHPDELIYTVASEQDYYFKTLFHSLGRLKVIDPNKCHHLSYGLVNLPDGRMKSREGTVVDADNLMDELCELATKKIGENHTDFSPSETHTIAEQVQNAAWKFFLLRTSLNKDITFDTQKSIDFQGATGPYLQYAGVRIKSILEKSKTQNPSSRTEDFSALGNAEKPLGVKILEWPGVLEKAAQNKNPTYIVTYLLELAQTWSSFYAENSVLNAETPELKSGRLALAAKVLKVLEKGLNILGIEIPKKM